MFRIASRLALIALTLSPVGAAFAESENLEDPIRHAQMLSRAFESVAQKVKPSVVNIMASKKVTPVKAPGRRPPPQMDPNSPFRDFFGDDFFEKFFPPQGPGGRGQQGLGTGVVVSEDGLILTNNHVIDGADEIKVRFHDGKTYSAERVGTDARTDVAVIRIKANGLVPAKLGNSDELKIGELVVASGNPFGLDSTITTGIVSAIGRSNITDPHQYEDFIQTDAAINPGNSGGPLLNLRGEVVGINTAILSRSGGYMGIGFAIPINMARGIMEKLISGGKVVRGWLGVIIQNLDEDLAASFQRSTTDGALVGDVQEKSPAAAAGLKQGDIIIGMNGREIKNVNQLRNMVADVAPKTEVKFKVVRAGKEIEVGVTIGEQQDDSTAAPRSEDSSSDLGLQLQTLTSQMAQELGIQKGGQGVLVMQVDPMGLAAMAGIRPRDIIRSVNGTPIKDVAEFDRLVKGAKSKGLRLVIDSNGTERFVFIRSQDE